MGIVATFIGAPEVVILDEPFANLDPTTQIRLKGIIKDLAAKSGVTVLVSSHDLMHVTEVCERIVVLEKGQIVKDIVTAPATLKELEAYFSGAAAAPSPTETLVAAASSPEDKGPEDSNSEDKASEDQSAITSDTPEK